MAQRPYITVVSGIPRSGTSMMMKMLEAGGVEPVTDHQRPPDPDNPGGYYELQAVKHTAEDASWLPLAVGRAVKVIHYLLPDLPGGYEYRVIMMNRRMDEILASQDAMLARLGRPRSGVPSEQLAQIFRQQLEQAEQWARAQPSVALLVVDFNDLLQSPEPWIGRINQFLDRMLNTLAMLSVVDPNLYRQRGRHVL